MARKIDRGLDIYDLLIDLVMNLTPLQAKNLYIELSARYIRKGRTKLYNRDGELDPKGKIRLCEYQYKALRTDYGDTYIKRAFAVSDNSNFIIWCVPKLSFFNSFAAKS